MAFPGVEERWVTDIVNAEAEIASPFLLRGRNVERMTYAFHNRGNALASLKIQWRASRPGQESPWFDLAGTAADYTAATLAVPLLRVIGSPFTLAADSSAAVLFETYGLSQIRVVATSSAAAGSTVTTWLSNPQ